MSADPTSDRYAALRDVLDDPDAASEYFRRGGGRDVLRALLAAHDARSPEPPSEWQPIATAPTTGPVVDVDLWNGEKIKRGHWARGGGEDQPPFGPAWFFRVGEGSSAYFAEMRPQPTHWRARSPERAAEPVAWALLRPDGKPLMVYTVHNEAPTDEYLRTVGYTLVPLYARAEAEGTTQETT